MTTPKPTAARVKEIRDSKQISLEGAKEIAMREWRRARTKEIRELANRNPVAALGEFIDFVEDVLESEL